MVRQAGPHLGAAPRIRRAAPAGINLFPEIGDKPIAEITAPLLLAAVRKIEHRGAHDLAHRVLQVASQVFRYGVATGRCERDPAPDLRGALTPHKGKHQAAVTPEELPALLRAIDGYGELGDKLTGYALRLLALTFVRTNELIGAEWEEFDLDSARVDHPGRADEDEDRTRRSAVAAGSRDAARGARHRRRQPLRVPRPQSGQADQQQHDAVRPVPSRLQGQDDRARLPRRGVHDPERSRISRPT